MRANLKAIRKAKLGAARVHRGFLRHADLLMRELEDDLGRLGKTTTVHATGHSLGGAMAVLMAMRHPVASVITFGEPRVGRDLDLEFPAATIHRRHVSGDDRVARVPPKLMRYEHHGMECRLPGSAGFDALVDHAIDCYSSRVS
jgi:predicted lipase